jgi:hypothetical protein
MLAPFSSSNYITRIDRSCADLITPGAILGFKSDSPKGYRITQISGE